MGRHDKKWPRYQLNTSKPSEATKENKKPLPPLEKVRIGLTFRMALSLVTAVAPMYNAVFNLVLVGRGDQPILPSPVAGISVPRYTLGGMKR